MEERKATVTIASSAYRSRPHKVCAAGTGKTMEPVVLPTADALPRRIGGGRSEPFPTGRAVGPRVVEGRGPFWRPTRLAVAGPHPPHDPGTAPGPRPPGPGSPVGFPGARGSRRVFVETSLGKRAAESDRPPDRESGRRGVRGAAPDPRPVGPTVDDRGAPVPSSSGRTSRLRGDLRGDPPRSLSHIPDVLHRARQHGRGIVGSRGRNFIKRWRIPNNRRKGRCSRNVVLTDTSGRNSVRTAAVKGSSC